MVYVELSTAVSEKSEVSTTFSTLPSRTSSERAMARLVSSSSERSVMPPTSVHEPSLSLIITCRVAVASPLALETERTYSPSCSVANSISGVFTDGAHQLGVACADASYPRCVFTLLYTVPPLAVPFV